MKHSKLVTAVVVAGVIALALAGCGGKTSTVNGRAVSGLYDPGLVGGQSVTDYPSGPRPNAPKPTGTVKNTDNGEIDRLSMLALNDLEEFWKQNWPTAAKKPFKPVSEVWSYDSRDPKSPAICKAKTYQNVNASYTYPCNLVKWDRGVLFATAQKYFGDMAVVAVLAHEFGHALQYNAGLVGNTTASIVKEQQADCYAGVYLRWVTEGHSSRFTLNTGDALSHVIAGMLRISDPLQSADEFEVTQQGAHGTGLDRVGAFQMGFETGSATCVGIDLNEIKNRRGDEPLALQVDDSGNTDSGEITIDNDVVGTLVETLNKIFSPKSPPTLSFAAESCSDARGTKGASYCPASNTVTADIPALQQIGKPAGRKGTSDPDGLLAGDDTALSIITSRYVLAIQHERGLPLDTPLAASRTACLTGAAQRNMAQQVSTPSGKQLVLSAGDLDEAIIGLLMNGVAASDVSGEHTPAGYTRIMSFRGGVMDNTDECFQRI